MKPFTENRRAHHKYEILETFDAGLALEGWEVKAIRKGQVQIGDSYVVVSRNELFLINATITPLKTTSTHVKAEPARSRKLLLHKLEIRRLVGKIKEKGLALIALNLHLSHNKVKAHLALAKGKNKVDKRRTLEQRQWEREEGRKLRKRY